MVKLVVSLFNGKERDEETGLYYYGARYYDPEGTNWYGVDPLWMKYPDISPYVYCAGNPIKYIDPNGMVIESLSRKQWDKEKSRITSRLERLENKNKNGRYDTRIASLNNTLNTMKTAEGSKQVYTLSNASGGIGGVELNTKTKSININYSGTANFVHELAHVEQFESNWGHIAFDPASGYSLGQDIYDEVQAYRTQYAYDPKSVTGLPSTSTINTMQQILPAWVQGLKGGTLYIPGNGANTGLSPVYINSTKEDLIRAYPQLRNSLNQFSKTIPFKNMGPMHYKR